MTAPDFRRGYLRVPLSVWLAVYCRGRLTRRQLQLVSAVIRETWGWQTPGGTVRLWSRPLLARHFADLTGLSTDHIARDLRELVERGALTRDGERYQFVADHRLWKTPTLAPLKVRQEALFLPPETAESAPNPPSVKTGKIKERNVAFAFCSHLYTGGDKSAAAALAPSQRLVAVVAAFVGPLTPNEEAALDEWMGVVGIAGVWAALEPAFRIGPAAARRRFETCLVAHRQAVSG